MLHRCIKAPQISEVADDDGDGWNGEKAEEKTQTLQCDGKWCAMGCLLEKN